MVQSTVFVGMDVHQDSVIVAVLRGSAKERQGVRGEAGAAA